MTIRELSTFIKESVDYLMEFDDDSTFFKPIDGDLAVYVGWGDGFDEKDETAIHSKKQPTYCICVKIAEYNPCCPLWDNVYMPWYVEGGEVYDTDCSLSANEDYENIVRWLLSEHKTIRGLLDEGLLTF